MVTRLTSLLVAVIAVALAGSSRGAQAGTTGRTLLHYGDSLSVGTGLFLPDALEG